MLRVMVVGARLVAREERRQRLRRLGPVHGGDRDQHDADDDGERNEQAAIHARDLSAGSRGRSG